jgi:hypothetical protein
MTFRHDNDIGPKKSYELLHSPYVHTEKRMKKKKKIGWF